jgi:hypothetical protein
VDIKGKTVIAPVKILRDNTDINLDVSALVPGIY